MGEGPDSVRPVGVSVQAPALGGCYVGQLAGTGGELPHGMAVLVIEGVAEGGLAPIPADIVIAELLLDLNSASPWPNSI